VTDLKPALQRKEYSSHPLLHDWQNWEERNGQNGYSAGAVHEYGIRTYANQSRPDMGIHTIYSGKALSNMKAHYEIDGIEILEYHVLQGHAVARLDIALDFLNCGLKVTDFEDAMMTGQATTKLRSVSKIQSLTGQGYTLYIGSRKRRKKLVRIYDKAAEQGLKADWIRIEVQFTGSGARRLSKSLFKSDTMELALLSHMRGVIDFPSIPEWVAVMYGFTPIRMGTRTEGVAKTRQWLDNQVLPALAKMAVLDYDWWVQFKFRLNDAVDELLEGFTHS